MGTETSLTEGYRSAPERRVRSLAGLSASQWTVLIVLGGLVLLIATALVLILRSGALESADVLAAAMAGPTPTNTSPILVFDAVPTPAGLYWPANLQPLAAPNAPGDLLWWDARFAYRRPVLLDMAATQAPPGTWVRLIFDGEGAQRDGKMGVHGADLRVLVWDGTHWWEIPRRARPRREIRGWNVLFHLQDPEIAHRGRYYLYYGNPFAGPPPVAEEAPETSRLLLSLGEEEGVEWGPEATWTANGTATQTLVSADGRIVIECPAGGPREDVRVRLRTVPIAERIGYGPLPDFELHADPPPGPPDASNIARWHPPLAVTLNWGGLPVDVVDLESWVHFVYDTGVGTWHSVPVEVDLGRGVIRVITDQP